MFSFWAIPTSDFLHRFCLKWPRKFCKLSPGPRNQVALKYKAKYSWLRCTVEEANVNNAVEWEIKKQTDDILFTERTCAMLNQPSIDTATVKLVNTRQHTNPLHRNTPTHTHTETTTCQGKHRNSFCKPTQEYSVPQPH